MNPPREDASLHGNHLIHTTHKTLSDFVNMDHLKVVPSRVLPDASLTISQVEQLFINTPNPRQNSDENDTWSQFASEDHLAHQVCSCVSGSRPWLIHGF
jgi:hypothetical protein